MPYVLQRLSIKERLSNLFGDNTTVTTLASLKALAVPSARRRIYMEGHSSAMDDGEGWFVWDPDSSATADDVLVVLPTGHTGNGRWLRQWNGVDYHVGWWGVDLTGATDNTTQVQAAWSAMITDAATAGTAPGRRLLFPAGTIKVVGADIFDGSSINDTDGEWSIHGMGSQHSMLYFDPSAEGSILFDLALARADFFEVKGLRIETDQLANHYGIAFKLGTKASAKSTNRFHMQDVYFRGFSACVQIDYGWIVNFVNVNMKWINRGLYVTNDLLQFIWTGGLIENYDTGIDAEQFYGQISGVTIESGNDTSATGIKVKDGGLIVTGGWFEGSGTYMNIGYDASETIEYFHLLGTTTRGGTGEIYVDNCESFVMPGGHQGTIFIGDNVEHVQTIGHPRSGDWSYPSLLTLTGKQSPWSAARPIWRTDMSDLSFDSGVTFSGATTSTSNVLTVDDLGNVQVIARACNIAHWDYTDSEVDTGKGYYLTGQRSMKLEIESGQQGSYNAGIIFRLQPNIADLFRVRHGRLVWAFFMPNDADYQLVFLADLNYESGGTQTDNLATVNNVSSTWDDALGKWVYWTVPLDFTDYMDDVEAGTVTAINYLSFELRFHTTSTTSQIGDKLWIDSIALYDTPYPTHFEPGAGEVYGGRVSSLDIQNRALLPRYATGSLPSAAVEGEVAYDTTTQTVKFYNGSSWGNI